MPEENLFTDFRLLLMTKDNLRAICSCKVAGAIWLTGIRVVEGSKGPFICMPSKKQANGEYQDIFFPGSRDIREKLQEQVLGLYYKQVATEGGKSGDQ